MQIEKNSCAPSSLQQEAANQVDSQHEGDSRETRTWTSLGSLVLCGKGGETGEAVKGTRVCIQFGMYLIHQVALILVGNLDFWNGSPFIRTFSFYLNSLVASFGDKIQNVKFVHKLELCIFVDI